MAIVRRAMLYVPSSSQKMLDKSRGLHVDCIAYDLEDSVAPDQKAEARMTLRRFLEAGRPQGVREVAVRINSVDSIYALDDITEILKAPHVDTLVVPKVQSASDLRFVTELLRHVAPERHSNNKTNHLPEPVRLLPLIESAKDLMNLSEICSSTPYISGLVFAAEDFCTDLSITRTPGLDEVLYARSAIVTAARAYNLPSTMDLVCTSFKGEDGQQKLREECVQGKHLGFNGKQLIHPSQIEVCQQSFAPSRDEVEWAVRVQIANEKADAQGRGAWTLDGEMVDVPVASRANDIVAKAKSCDIDISQIRQEWKDQEPE